jgi:thiol-disulfide isomerase/thioredoxin
MMLWLLVACDDPPPAAPPPSRVNAVMSTPAVSDAALGAFCENRAEAGHGPVFSWPELDTPAPAAVGSWRWINIWATWCKPCIEEMPMLVGWKKRLEESNIAIDLQFVSVDAKAEDVEKFLSTRADFPKGSRVKEFATVAGWLSGLGLDAGTSIPIHFFVDPSSHVRCTRVGSVGEPDYPVIKKLLSSK